MKFFNNDTIVLSFLGIAMLLAIAIDTDIALVTGIIGAIGGYLGSQTVNK